MTQQTQRYYEDVWPGDEFAIELQPTKADVEEFMDLHNMTGPDRQGRRGPGDGRFQDEALAKQLGLARPIVPGNMSMALITRLVTDWMGAMGHLHSIDASFRRPVMHDDKLRAVALVTDADDSTGEPLATLDVFFENERGERPVQGTAVVELPRRAAAPAISE